MTREPVTLTIDVETHGSSSDSFRFLTAMEPLLEVLAKLDIKATFFVVGEISDQCNELLGNLHSFGHEIALHGNTHTPLQQFTQMEFRNDVKRGRDKLESIIQTSILGYRAPYFSLTKKTLWAPQILSEENFVYSSSVLPAFNPQAGFPFAPRQPFLWPSGLIEFPVPTFGFGPIRVPLLGGAYLRISPLVLVKMARYLQRNSIGTWTYCHPYDFDEHEEFSIRDGEGWLFSRLLFSRRRLMLKRISSIVSPGSCSLIEMASDEALCNRLPKWIP